MRVGFTGTREGMSLEQADQLCLMLLALSSGHNEFHFGGADGADCEALLLALGNGYLAASIHVHPCPGVTLEKLRDAVHGWDGDGFTADRFVWHEVFPPLVRNRDIVRDVEVLIAAPRHDREEKRSGTWATVRYARQARKPVVMLTRGR